MRKLAVLCAAFWVLASCVRESSPPSDQMLNIGSHRLQIHLEGKGTPAVVIDAGLADQLDKLRPLQKRLARVTRVITYNRAGYGKSEPGPLPRHSGREAEELRTLLEKASIPGPYVLVGHSLGKGCTPPSDKLNIAGIGIGGQGAWDLQKEDGMIFVGDKGKLLVTGWGGESPRLIPESKMQVYELPPKKLPRSIGQQQKWIEACKKRTPTRPNFDFAGPLTEAVLFGLISVRLGGKKLGYGVVPRYVPSKFT